jgi:hypothetical protein
MRMRKSRRLLYLLIIVVVVGVSAFVLSYQQKYGEIKGTVADVLSGDAVRHVTIQVDGKSTIKFASTSFNLTEISPGAYTLKATAPGYDDFTLPVDVKRGQNRVDIAMKGREVPDLSGIIIFTEPREKGLEIGIRFVDSQNLGILSYPTLPLTLEGALFVWKGTEENYEKGREVYRGPIEMFWDRKERLEKNKGLIPWEKIKVDCENEKNGILEVVLHTPQGDFRDATTEVELCPKPKE